MIRLALIISLISTVSATTFVERPLQEAVGDAAVVVRGTAGKSTSNWGKTDEGTRNIYTYTELQVSEVLRGPGLTAPTTIQVRSLGGEKDGIGMQVSGVASFNPGEETIVLLREKNSEGSYDVDGMMMGKFNLRTDEEGHEVVIGPGIPRSETGSKWTFQAFRDLVASQPAPRSRIQPSAGPSAAASLSPVRQEADAPVSTPSEAPRLQPSPGEEVSPDSGLPSQHHLEWWSVLGTAGILVLLFVFLRRRNK